MKVGYWIRIKANKRYNSYVPTAPSISVSKPSTGKGEIAIKVNFDIPDSYFELPELQASVVLPDKAAKDNIINAEVKHNISELVERELGIKLYIGDEDVSN